MTRTTRRPVVLSCGEPAGIGPEIAAMAWEKIGSEIPFFYLGDARHLPKGTPIAEIESPEDTAEAIQRGLPVLSHAFPAEVTPGTPDPDNASDIVAVIAKGVDLVRSGQASALCTAPIHKKALMDGAGFAFPGHTEYLASLAGLDRVVMMVACDTLRVVPVTIHIALQEVSSTLSADLLSDTLRITRRAMVEDFGIPDPRICVAGLNPHAGEGGAMGREDMDLIAPVLDALRDEGFDLRGPVSADTMFHAKARSQYDVAVAMYHDQALIPIKTLDFDGGVNVTLGLPFIRTSPDHGTALDIAGKGLANPSSLIAALRMADTMASARAS